MISAEYEPAGGQPESKIKEDKILLWKTIQNEEDTNWRWTCIENDTNVRIMIGDKARRWTKWVQHYTKIWPQ